MADGKLVALHGPDWSLVFETAPGALPIWRHLGRKTGAPIAPLLKDVRSRATFTFDHDPAMQAFPTALTGWPGIPAIELLDASGGVLHPHFDQTDVETDAGTLRITAHDTERDLRLILSFEALDGGALQIRSQIDNTGEHPVSVARMASAVFPLPSDADRIVSWRGRHNGEFTECSEPMPEHAWVRENRQGMPGHGGPPGCVLLSRGAGWHDGMVFSPQIAWSGNCRITVERHAEGFSYCVGEASLAPKDKVLGPGESYFAPPITLAISSEGRGGAMRQHHAAIRAALQWPDKAMSPRPVHLNSWEACYFNHDSTRIAALIEQAAAIGAERFVLDDGWFKGRHNDRAGLGDWVVDAGKYPRGLGEIAELATAAGMQFGLWVEPEMVSPDSDLYRAHPEWVLSQTESPRHTARNQLVLDMRQPDVRDHIFAALDRLLGELPIGYLKWDHNRAHAPSGGARQVEGTYDLLARLRAAHPSVEIESCAAGGGRVDGGIVQYVHRFWTSDNIDAASRTGMQRGFLAFMPPEIMGCHVGASPSHATGRVQSLDFRAAIAMQGHFGVELDPGALTEDDRAALRGWTGFYKEWRGLIHSGAVHLGEGNDGIVWQAQGRDGEWLLWVIRTDAATHTQEQPICLPFAEGRDWEISLLKFAGNRATLAPQTASGWSQSGHKPLTFGGEWLASAGLAIPALSAENAAIFHMKALR